MSKSSKSARARKPDRPQKPYPDFPLSPHASGAWQKKIRGKIHYFGRWARVVEGKLTRVPGDGWEDALREYQEVRDDLHAGRTPRVNADGLAVGDLCNRFLTSKLRKQEAGELGRQTFADYKIVTDLMVATFGAGRLVEDLAADDFAILRDRMVKQWGPVRLANSITRAKSVFKYAADNGLVEKAVRYGTEFRKPDQSVLRRHRAKSGERMLEPDQLRTIIDAAPVPLKAMILLGLNAGLGNNDCATLPLSAVNLETGWLNFPRPKTGIGRRCPLWPETVEAVRQAIAERPTPADLESCGLAFLTAIGTPWVRASAAYRSDHLTKRFIELLQKLKLHRKRAGFYTLRHVFRTVADAARDTPAVDLIMGHNDPSMAGHYRERIDDTRLRTVVDHVHRWLWPRPPVSESPAANT
jgi:integrase